MKLFVFCSLYKYYTAIILSLYEETTTIAINSLINYYFITMHYCNKTRLQGISY